MAVERWSGEKKKNNFYEMVRTVSGEERNEQSDDETACWKNIREIR